MTAFRSIVFSAVLAGLIVGAFVTAAQRVGTVPIILQAEVYERQAEAAGHQHATTGPERAVTHEDDAVAAHSCHCADL
jgi:predicted cobalt transporter CbtA